MKVPTTDYSVKAGKSRATLNLAWFSCGLNTFYRAYTKIANCLSSWNEHLAQHRSEICWVVGMRTSSRTAQKPETFFCWSHVLDRENSQQTRKMQSTKILPERAVAYICSYIYIYIHLCTIYTYIYTHNFQYMYKYDMNK